MKHFLVALVFLSATAISVGVYTKSNKSINYSLSFSQKNQETNKLVTQSIYLANNYSYRTKQLYDQDKISMKQKQEIENTIEKYTEYISLKRNKKNLNSKTSKIGNAMLKLKIKRILNGSEIKNYNVSSIYR